MKNDTSDVNRDRSKQEEGGKESAVSSPRLVLGDGGASTQQRRIVHHSQRRMNKAADNNIDKQNDNNDNGYVGKRKFPFGDDDDLDVKRKAEEEDDAHDLLGEAESYEEHHWYDGNDDVGPSTKSLEKKKRKKGVVTYDYDDADTLETQEMLREEAGKEENVEHHWYDACTSAAATQEKKRKRLSGGEDSDNAAIETHDLLREGSGEDCFDEHHWYDDDSFIQGEYFKEDYRTQHNDAAVDDEVTYDEEANDYTYDHSALY